MVRKRQPSQQKIRTREHVIADLAVNHVERQGLLCGYSFERVVHDYGLDCILVTYNASGELEDGAIDLQVKGRDKTRRVRGRQAVAIQVSRADIITWTRRLMPVILIVYDASEDMAYWLNIQQYFAQLPGFNLFAASETVTLHVTVTQTVTPDAMRQFAGFRDDIIRQLRQDLGHA
jgi:hypothetical protein